MKWIGTTTNTTNNTAIEEPEESKGGGEEETAMKIYGEMSLREFEFWSGARQTAEMCTPEELDQIEEELIDCYPEGIDETQLNDIFWFDSDFIAEILGYEDFNEMYEARHKKPANLGRRI